MREPATTTVAIVGAGLSGLITARELQRRSSEGLRCECVADIALVRECLSRGVGKLPTRKLALVMSGIDVCSGGEPGATPPSSSARRRAPRAVAIPNARAGGGEVG